VNTPSHAILNLAILGRKNQTQYNLAIALGGIIPDVPIFVFFLWARFIRSMPASEIWTTGYYQPFWQDVIATSHSIPLALLAAGLAHYRSWQTAELLFLSMVFHDLLDLPVHHDDAHRHFFPFSNYRFISPISYYDPAHYGNIVAAIEVLLVLAATLYLFRSVRSRVGKGLMILANVFYLGGYLALYLRG
jgi:membrane-bound metal-dependent hydrolase YbcI (DUF457 family)